jgi:hypothetical protein
VSSAANLAGAEALPEPGTSALLLFGLLAAQALRALPR